MPSCNIYVSPNTITDLRAYSGTSLRIDTNEWTVSGDYLYASWSTSGGNLTFKATGYQDKTQEVEPGSNYVTMVAVTPKYIFTALNCFHIRHDTSITVIDLYVIISIFAAVACTFR